VLATDGSPIGFWAAVVVVLVSIAVIALCRRRLPPGWRSRWALAVGATVGGAIGAVVLGPAIRSDLQYEPPESNHYEDFRGVYDAAPWVGAVLGVLVGAASATLTLSLRSRTAP
jgi:hypothetical protein